MKKIIFSFSVLFSVLVLFGCKKENADEVADQSVAKTVDASGKEKSVSLILYGST